MDPYCEAAQLLRDAGYPCDRVYRIEAGIDPIGGYDCLLYVTPMKRHRTALARRVAPNGGWRFTVWDGWEENEKAHQLATASVLEDVDTHNND